MRSCYVIGDDYLTSFCIECLIKHSDWEVLGLVTTSDRLKEQWVGKLQLYNSLADFSKTVEKKSFDYLFSIVNAQIIPAETLSLPRYLAINYHSSLLPKYAGWEPISWAILNEENMYGITWHVMCEQMDSGGIVLQVPFEIEPNETAFTLRLKCFDAGLNSFSKLMELLHAEAIPKAKAQDFGVRSYYGRNQKPKAMGFIDWQSSAEGIHRLCRAFYFGDRVNWVVAPKILLNSNVFIVEKAEILPRCSNTVPGTVVGVEKDALIVSTKTYDIKLSPIKNLMGDEVCLSNFITDAVSTTTAMPTSVMTSTHTIEKEDGPGGKVLLQENKCYVGDDLQIDSNILNELDSSFHKGAYIDELFLLRALEHYEPLEVTGISNQEIGSYPSETTILLTDEKKEDYADFLSVICLYFARFSQQENLSLKIQYADKCMAPKKLSQCFSYDVPFNVNIDFEAPYRELEEKIAKQLSNKAYQKMHSKEIAYRYKLHLEGKYQLFLDTKITVVLCENIDSYPVSQSGFYILLAPKQGIIKLCVHSDCKDFIFLSKNLQSHLPGLYKKVFANPDLILSQIPVIPESEQQKMVYLWNDTKVDYPFSSLYDMVLHQVENRSKEKALIVDNTAFTYEALISTSEKMARVLFHHYKVKPQDRIGIMMHRSSNMITVVLALLRLNCQIIPITSTKMVKEISEVILSGTLNGIIVDKEFMREISELLPECPLISFEDLNRLFTTPFLAIPEIVIHPDDVALITLTSGTTGLPKAIPTTQDAWVNWVHYMKNSQYVNEKDVIFSTCSFGFDAFFWELFALGLGQGACVVLSSEVDRLDTSYWKRLFQMRTVSATQVTITPSMLSLFSPEDFPYIKRIYCIGEKLSMNLIKPFLLKGIEVVNGYGPSEVTAGATLYRCQLDQMPYIGGPIQNTQIYILDQFKQPVPMGAYGEIYIAGKGLSPGYLQLPEKNATCFVTHPFTFMGKVYKTGDRARYVNGTGVIEFLSRIEDDQQVKMHGVRIELGEIAFLLSCQPGIRAAHVCVINNGLRERLVAYIVTDRSDLSEKSIRQALRDKIDFFKIPERIMIVDQFPLNHRGKIDSNRLPNPFANYVAVFQNESLDLKERVLSIFRYYLDLPELELDDCLDESGGNSFSIMTIWNKINQVLLKSEPDSMSLADFMLSCDSPRKAALWVEAHLKPLSDSVIQAEKDQDHETTSSLLLSFGIFDVEPVDTCVLQNNADNNFIGTKQL